MDKRKNKNDMLNEMVEMIIDINKVMKGKIVIINDDTMFGLSYIYMNKDIIYQKYDKINKLTLQDFMTYAYMTYEWDGGKLQLDQIAIIMGMGLKNVHRLEKLGLDRLKQIKHELSDATDTIEK